MVKIGNLIHNVKNLYGDLPNTTLPQNHPSRKKKKKRTSKKHMPNSELECEWFKAIIIHTRTGPIHKAMI